MSTNDTRTITYTVHGLDVWGNEEDGYEVNDVYPSQGKVVIGEGQDVLRTLISAGYVSSGVDMSQVIVNDDARDDNIYIEYMGKPKLELRAVLP